MKKLILLLSLILIYSHAFSQNEANQDTPKLDSVDIISYWYNSDTVRYEVVKSKFKYKGESDIAYDSTINTSWYQFVVKDSTTAGYTIEITPLQTPNSLKNNIVSEMIGIEGLMELAQFSDLKIIYKIDANGVFLGIENVGEIAVIMNKLFDLIIEKQKKLDKTKGEEGERLINNLRPMVTSKEYIEKKAFQEFAVIHTYFGTKLAIDSVTYYEDSYPNLFDPEGDPIPVNCALIATLPEEGILEIEVEKETDSTATKKLVTDYLKKVINRGAKKEINIDKEFEKMSISILDNVYFRFVYPSCWLVNCVFKRWIRTSDRTHLELMEIRMLPPDN